MGVVNVTPDSFSDPGVYFATRDAVRHGLELVAAGADLVDVGGESTRPGAARVSPAEEADRVLPVVTALAARGVVVSVDTTRASVAGPALAAGAFMVNDVSGGSADPELAALVAERGVPYVVMHSRGPSADMASRAVYADVVAEVVAELAGRLEAVLAAGVRAEQVVLDPGLGFAKTAGHNWTLLAHLDALLALGRPVLVGASRKSFLGALLAAPDGTPRPVDSRDAATAATSALAAAAGAWAVRVHDVGPSADAVRVAASWRSAAEEAAR
ncbi:MAG: dihydropteroate synthase [Mycobacteriales bacterium]